MSTTPNFSPYPFDRLPRMSRVQARLESLVARWLAAGSLAATPSGSSAATPSGSPAEAPSGSPAGAPSSSPAGAPSGSRLTKLVGAPTARVVPPSTTFDPFAAICIVHTHGLSIECRASSTGVRAIAKKLLGGPDELSAPRPLMLVEQSLWSQVVATAVEDLGIEARVWPVGVGGPRAPTSAAWSNGASGAPTGVASSGASGAPMGVASSGASGAPMGVASGVASGGPSPASAHSAAVIALDVYLGDVPLAVELLLPPEIALRLPPARRIPAWADRIHLDVPLIVGRCALAREDLARLSPRSLITLEAPSTGIELEILGGTLGLRAAPKALVAEVATGYLPRDMTLPDAAHVELTVALGTTQLSLRQVFELSIGQIISLGRPLAGPFELRAAGKIVGTGELVDVDGELAVRIVSLGDQE